MNLYRRRILFGFALVIGSCPLLLLTLVLRLQRPELTETQLFLEYGAWYVLGAAIVLLVAYVLSRALK